MSVTYISINFSKVGQVRTAKCFKRIPSSPKLEANSRNYFIKL